MGQPSNLIAVPYKPDNINRKVINRDLTGNFVVANAYSPSTLKVLRPTSDEVEIEINLKTYEKMENDSAIAKSKRILVTSVLADDLQFSPGVTEEEVGPEEFDVYTQVMEFNQRVANGLDTPIRSMLEQLLGNGIRHGHGIGEIEWDYRKDAPSTKPAKDSKPKTKVGAMFHRIGVWFGKEDTSIEAADNGKITRPTLKGETLRLMPKSIKVKPRGAARFVVDQFMTVLGLVPKYRDYSKLGPDEIIDRDKFVILTLNKQDEDPRGKSTYRPAYNWYNLKSQLPAEMLRFILEEAVPKAVGMLPPDSAGYEFERDDDGNVVYEEDGKTPKLLTLAESFKKQIEGFRSGSGAVIPNGATLSPFKTGSTGATDTELFSRIIKIINDEIENAILLQTLAQSEGQHQARSASEQVAVVLYNLVFWTRWAICMVLMSDVFEVATRINLGEWALRYMPQISLGDFVRRNWVDDLGALADAYFKGFIDDTQRPELMAWMNLPKPGVSRQEQQAQQDINGEAVPPNSKRPDKQAGNKNRNRGNGTEKKDVNQNTDSRFSPLNMLGHHRGWTTRFKRNI